jgi:hypothetical protein
MKAALYIVLFTFIKNRSAIREHDMFRHTILPYLQSFCKLFSSASILNSFHRPGSLVHSNKFNNNSANIRIHFLLRFAEVIQYSLRFFEAIWKVNCYSNCSICCSYLLLDLIMISIILYFWNSDRNYKVYSEN